MTLITGSCAAKVQSQTIVIVPGPEDRQMSLAVMVGKHTSPDPAWEGATMTYVGHTDILNGRGDQNGYFNNIHRNGDVSHGVFEATCTPEMVKGTWTLFGGSGTLAGVVGGGVFEARLTSSGDSEMTWSGTYEA
jgi:hypothetical protein